MQLSLVGEAIKQMDEYMITHSADLGSKEWSQAEEMTGLRDVFKDFSVKVIFVYRSERDELST